MPPDSAIKSAQHVVEKARHSLDLASIYSFNRQHDDGHWCGEIKHDPTMTAEVVMLRQALGLDMSIDRDDIIAWFLSEQREDGSWGWAPGLPGDVSPTVEVYFALKLLGIPPDAAPMCHARRFIQDIGGVAKVRIFTRIYLAIFGLFPWDSVPELPPELILFPPVGPINVYRLAAWARLAIIPLLIVSHHRPIFALPNGRFEANDYLDELWCNPAQKATPYSQPLWDLVRTDFVAFAFAITDKMLSYAGGLRNSPTRGYARTKCIEWILDRQEGKGDIGGMFPGLVYSILALRLEGYKLDDPPLFKAIKALERFSWEDETGKRYQSCKGPVWDSILMTIALCDAGVPKEKLTKTVDWILSRQSLDLTNDWRIFRPQSKAGGFGFFEFVSKYPDTDDTSAAIIALFKYCERLNESQQELVSVTKATEWLLGMQNDDGGWGAFDADNDYIFWNKVPFSDMDALSDPSSSDVTGRILEAFGLLLQDGCLEKSSPDLVKRVKIACDRAIDYLVGTQEPTGAWYGRWGTNYIYGTCNVLCGLAKLSDLSSNQRMLIKDLVQSGISWIKARQNADGGWGETVMSYKDPSLAGQGPSTASQTAWALLALMAHCPVKDDSIRDGILFLLETQTLSKDDKEASWPTDHWTGTGFPGVMYLGYTFYSHYFPMMALGRYLQKTKH